MQELKKRKYCRRCGIFISPENEQYGAGDFCKSCAESMVSRQSFNMPADLLDEINTEENFDAIAETDGTDRTDSTTDIKYCRICGREITAKNGMHATNPDRSRNEEYCQLCIKDREMLSLFGIAFSLVLFLLIFVYTYLSIHWQSNP